MYMYLNINNSTEKYMYYKILTYHLKDNYCRDVILQQYIIQLTSTCIYS
jgi:hypothetical protein